MKTIKIDGNLTHVTAVMVPREAEYHDHETIRLESSVDGKSVEKTIFRVVDGGEDKWELQFE
jgi:hypothetical protein